MEDIRLFIEVKVTSDASAKLTRVTHSLSLRNAFDILLSQYTKQYNQQLVTCVIEGRGDWEAGKFIYLIGAEVLQWVGLRSVESSGHS